jgi:hypothetical protein
MCAHPLLVTSKPYACPPGPLTLIPLFHRRIAAPAIPVASTDAGAREALIYLAVVCLAGGI